MKHHNKMHHVKLDAFFCVNYQFKITFPEIRPHDFEMRGEEMRVVLKGFKKFFLI